MNTFYPIPKALKELKKGNMLIVVDNLDRENQGDLIFPAETATPQKVNFLLQKCRGMVCVAITKKQAVQLDLPLMVAPIDNTEMTNVQFTVSVDAKDVASFGIAASDKAKTIKALADIQSASHDFVRPGHIFPLLARDGGVKERSGHTEATVDLMRLSGFSPCGVLCEILTDDGEIARLPELIQFSKKYNISIVSIEDLIAYVKGHPAPSLETKTISRAASSLLPTAYGLFHLSVYKSIIDSQEHIALWMGEKTNEPILTRIHSQCITGDTFSSRKCDCREQLHQSLQLISKRKEGVVIYLNQEGRGIGLSNKIKAYGYQDKGLDTIQANEALGLPIDARDYTIAAEILRDLGISTIQLLTNNPDKIKQLKSFGIDVIEHVPLEVVSHETNKNYLQVKRQKLGHLLKNV